MYGRSKIDSFDTINLCNQFLILYLAKKAQSFENRGLINNARVYKNAINSIKRYPLPIICKAQLQSLNGIGQYLSDQLQKVIKNHYSAFLDCNLKPKSTNQQQKVNQQQGKQMRNGQKSTQKMGQNQPQQNLNDSRTAKSVTSQYKPRINTANSYFLQVLVELSGTERNSPKLISQRVVNCQVMKKYPTAKNKAWKLLEQTLQSHGYIRIQSKKEQDLVKQGKFYELTEKGYIYNKSLAQKAKNNQTKNKIVNHVKQFKQQIMNSKNNFQKKNSTNLNAFGFTNDEKQSDTIMPKILQLPQTEISFDKLTLVIDMREKNEKIQSNFFLQKITKKYSIKCETSSLNLGDFLWIYDNKVLDFIIERKKADDLAASIIDGRYKDQKYRLHESGITNIFYIYEGYPSDNCCLTQKELNNALLKTRTKEKFKVFQTKDVNQTMKLLNTFHMQIFEKIRTKKAKYLCLFQQFNEMNSIQKNFTVGKIFALGLMAIPGVGKNSIHVLTKYFKTYKAMYDYLSKLDSNSQRVQFLKTLFKGSGLMTSLPGILVELLFSQNYAYKKQNKIEEKNFISSNDIISLTQQKSQYRFEQQLERVQKKRFSVIHQEHQINSDHEEEIQI